MEPMVIWNYQFLLKLVKEENKSSKFVLITISNFKSIRD